MNVVTVLDVYTTEVKNSDFNAADMIRKLDIQDFIIDVIGEDQFYKKFNIPNTSKTQ